jgi:mono/diheme cytochrome c family protein
MAARRSSPRRCATLWVVVVALGAMASSCRMDMHDQPKYQPYERSRFFADGRAARPVVPGTVARGQLREDAWFHRGVGPSNAPASAFPSPVTVRDLERGRERYDVYCSPCHDRTGGGNGMIVQRGFPAPVSFHEARLREAPVGHFFQAITGGFGVMPSYATQIPVADRWAIIAYIRALQLSQHASISDVPADERAKLGGQP